MAYTDETPPRCLPTLLQQRVHINERETITPHPPPPPTAKKCSVRTNQRETLKIPPLQKRVSVQYKSTRNVENKTAKLLRSPPSTAMNAYELIPSYRQACRPSKLSCRRRQNVKQQPTCWATGVKDRSTTQPSNLNIDNLPID